MANILIEKLIYGFQKIHGLFLGLFVVFGFISYFNPLVNELIADKVLKLILYVLILIVYIVIWSCVRFSHPNIRFSKGVAVVFSFDYENMEQKHKVESDVVQKVVDLICIDGLVSKIHSFKLNSYQVYKVNKIMKGYLLLNPKKYRRAFLKLINQNKYSVFIWGSVKQRNDKENSYIINSNVLSKHTEIKDTESQKLSLEISKLIPNTVKFPVTEEYSGFNLTKEMLYIAIRYITGTILFLSNDIDGIKEAYRMHEGLVEAMQDHMLPNSNDVLLQLKRTHGVELFYISQIEFYEKNDSVNALELNKKAVKYFPDSAEILQWNGYLYFDVERNTGLSYNCFFEAKKIKPIMKIIDFNIAFLHMYLRRFDEALQILDTLAMHSSEEFNTYSQSCINYDIKLLEKEPDKIQFLFTIGYLYYRIQSNPVIAMEYFEDFITQSYHRRHFGVLTKRAHKYLSTIRKIVPS